MHLGKSQQTKALAKLAGSSTSFKDQLEAFRKNKEDLIFNRKQLIKFATESRDDIFVKNEVKVAENTN